MRIDERIERHYAELSPQEQKAADTLLDRLGDLAVYNAAELARLSGVSKATMSRLFRRLGFEDFNEVKEHTRSIRSSGMPLGPQSSDGGLAAHLGQEQENLRRLAESLDEDKLSAASGKLAGAGTVLLLGFRNSFPVALHFRQQLLQCRPARVRGAAARAEPRRRARRPGTRGRGGPVRLPTAARRVPQSPPGSVGHRGNDHSDRRPERTPAGRRRHTLARVPGGRRPCL